MPRLRLSLRALTSYGKSWPSPLVVTVLCLLVLPIPALIRSYPSEAASASGRPPLARLSGAVRAKATNTRNPAVHLSDGHEILTAYAGPEELRTALEQNRAKPLSLASADFDEDGVPDLITGYSFEGHGIVTLMRGNVDAIYPNSPEAQRRRANGTFTNAPFLSPAYVFATPVAAEFIGAGDFDGDSHWDVIAASTNDTALSLLAGNGRGEFPAVKKTTLPGVVTALAAGEINRRDALADVIVGVDGPPSPQVLVFEGPTGAFNSTPEVLPVPSRVASLALGQLDNSYEIDLVIASGSELIFLQGRDRQLLAEPSDRVGVAAPHLEHRSFPGTIRDLTLGDFKAQQKLDVAVLTHDGNVELLDAGGAAGAPFAQWKAETLERSWGDTEKLFTAKVSSLPGDDLLVSDGGAGSVQIVRTASIKPNTQIAAQERGLLSAIEGFSNDPIAILPMRLNSDAFADLTIVESGRSAPTIVTSAPGTTFDVINTNDSGPGSLRQAVLNSESNPGADTITFHIGSGPQTIALLSHLPLLGDSVTIDASTQPGYAGQPLIELNGTSVEADYPSFAIYPGNSVVRGFVINRFHSDGLNMSERGGNIIEGNYIGTDRTGTIALPNDFRGIGVGEAPDVSKSSDNRIGGTTTQARNLISGNKVHGIRILNSGSTGNVIQGNYIGTDITGTKALGNFVEGVYIGGGNNNTVGGTTAGARNLVSANGFQGTTRTAGLAISTFPFLVGATGNTVQGNYVGTNAGGTAALGNGHEGVLLEDGATSNLVGGTTTAARNLISGNNTNGVDVGFSKPVTLNQILGNYIGTDVTGELPVGNLLQGIFINVNSVNNIIRDNRIAFNGQSGVFIPNDTPAPGDVAGFRIAIDTNEIYKNGGLGIDLGNAGITANDPLDVDGGGNLQQNFPVLTSVTGPSALGETVWERAGEVGREMPDPALAAALTIHGTLNSTANATFTIHWYFSTDAACVNNELATRPACGVGGCGKIPGVTTDNSGNAAFDIPFDFPPGMTSGVVNCTATDAQGNTSEFSACFPVTKPTGTSLTNVQGSGTFGGTATLTATLTSNGSAVSGKTINFTLNNAAVCAGATGVTCPTTNSSGIATLSGVSLTGINAGSYPGTVGASFAGDASYSSGSGTGQLTVSRANQTITVNNHAPTNSTYNSQFNVAATASSGLSVTYSSSGACTNTGATFTMTSGTGTCNAIFNQAGNSNYNAAGQVTENVTAQKASATITLSNLMQAFDGLPKFATASTTPAGLTVNLTYSQNGNPVSSPTSLGAYAVSAVISNANYQGSTSGTLNIVIFILVETGGSNLAALDSVALTRGPFTLTHNYNSDHRTRIIFFTTNLGLAQTTQPPIGTLSVQLNGTSYPVESVGPNSTISGSYIVLRLPDLAAPGTYPLGIRLNGVSSANTPNLQIVSSPTSSSLESAPAAPKSNKANLFEYLLFSRIEFFF